MFSFFGIKSSLISLSKESPPFPREYYSACPKHSLTHATILPSCRTKEFDFSPTVLCYIIATFFSENLSINSESFLSILAITRHLPLGCVLTIFHLHLLCYLLCYFIHNSSDTYSLLAKNSVFLSMVKTYQINEKKSNRSKL